MASYLLCPGNVDYIYRGRVDCSEDLRQYTQDELIAIWESQGVISQDGSSTVSPTATTTIDPIGMGAVWGFAFATVIAFWVMGLKISIARKGINSVR